MIKLNIKFDRCSISLRELRSHFDHAPEADDHQGLDRYAVGFALELTGSIMFPDKQWRLCTSIFSTDFDGKSFKIIYLS
jgi:hypothetical protein